ncbi:hypothetical protein AGMMS50212_14550 [Spirochaetia bacterium]|nr:hypothetical protein AGMMS50212_14550 [Spirochaetia bacterium]
MFDKYVDLIKNSECIDNTIINFICSPHNKYIWGNGLQVAVCLGIFRDMNVPINGILLDDGMVVQKCKGYWEQQLRKVTSVWLSDFIDDKTNSDILIAVPSEMQLSAINRLKQHGFLYIYTCCWKHNSDFREICYSVYESEFLNNYGNLKNV